MWDSTGIGVLLVNRFMYTITSGRAANLSLGSAVLLLLGEYPKRLFAVSLPVEYVAADSRRLLVSSIE